MLTSVAGMGSRAQALVRNSFPVSGQAFGRTLSSHFSRKQPELRASGQGKPGLELKALGVAAVREARRQIIGSSNLHMVRQNDVPEESERLALPGFKDNFNRHTDFEEWQLLQKRMAFVRKHTLWLMKQHQCEAFDIPPAPRLRKIHMAEELNKLCPYGNCSALAETAFLDLYRKQQFPLELIYQFSKHEGKDHSHAFVTLNRDKNSELTGPEGWGEEALIVDAWLPAVFFADQMPLMQRWLPGTFDMKKVLSVIRLEEPLPEGEVPAVRVKSNDITGNQNS